MKITALDPHSQAAQDLFTLSDDYLAALYPAESIHSTSATDLSGPSSLFLGVADEQNMIGCGSVMIIEGDIRYGELKRVFIKEAYRGQGLSRKLICALEDHLIKNLVEWVRLETGIYQAEALGLYQSLGYAERGPYGAYSLDPLSIFMEKYLKKSEHLNAIR
jgi:putative acetyltransferase